MVRQGYLGRFVTRTGFLVSSSGRNCGELSRGGLVTPVSDSGSRAHKVTCSGQSLAGMEAASCPLVSSSSLTLGHLHADSQPYTART